MKVATASCSWFYRGAQVLVLEPMQARVEANTARYPCADLSWLGGAIGARFAHWPSYMAGTRGHLKTLVGSGLSTGGAR